MSDSTPTRRHFLAATGMASLGAVLASGGEAAPAAEPARPGPPPDRPRDLKPTGSDLGTLFADVEKLAEANRYSLALSGGRFRTFEDFKAAARQKVLDLLLYKPEKVDPRPEVLERVDRDDHVREKVLFSTSPHFRVPAYVLVPKKRRGPAPAIVDLHSHGGMFLFGKEKVVDLGDNHPAMTAYQERNYEGRPTATALVRRGYVVVTIDALMFGERRILMDTDLSHGWDRSKYGPDAVAHLNQVCRSKEATLVKGLTLAGATWPGIVFWDDLRTVDYLATRPEVDPKRIGCVGISMGGYRALYLAALDDRIAAACVAGFMSSFRPMIQMHLDIHSWVHFLPALHRYLDLPDVASLAAPRALLVQQCARDRLFPPEGMKESVATIAAAFDKAGVAKQFSGRFYDVPHQFTRAMQDDAFAWFDRHLSPGTG
jgi:dienelactone hydrolase